MRVFAGLVLSLFLAEAASARPRSPTPSRQPDRKPTPAVEAPGTVHGRVVTPWGWGISQRLVSIGEQRTFTDGEGRFTFENVPQTYDIRVAERSGLHATVYYGLTRRDPALGHQAWPATLDGYREKQDRPPSQGIGRIAGTVELLKAKMPPQITVHNGAERLSFSYVFADGASALSLGECPASGSYDCELPDYTSLGGTYCMAIARPPGLSEIRAMRCGGKLGMKDFSIPAQPPVPRLTIGSLEDGDRMLSWSGEGQVFELNLGHDFEGTFVRVYTSKRSFTWTELQAVGVNFRWNRAVSVEGVKVTALLPYSSVDDLAGRGPLAMGTSWSKLESNEVNIPIPAGFKAAPLTRRPGPFNLEDPRSVPTCAAPDAPALAVSDLKTSMANTRITVRGKLGCGRRSCIEQGCGYAELLLVDARNPKRGIYLQRAEDIAPLQAGESCESTKRPDLEMIATGLLLSRGFEPAGVQSYLLDQASVCVVRSARKP